MALPAFRDAQYRVDQVETRLAIDLLGFYGYAASPIRLSALLRRKAQPTRDLPDLSAKDQVALDRLDADERRSQGMASRTDATPHRAG